MSLSKAVDKSLHIFGIVCKLVEFGDWHDLQFWRLWVVSRFPRLEWRDEAWRRLVSRVHWRELMRVSTPVLTLFGIREKEIPNLWGWETLKNCFCCARCGMFTVDEGIQTGRGIEAYEGIDWCGPCGFRRFGTRPLFVREYPPVGRTSDIDDDVVHEVLATPGVRCPNPDFVKIVPAQRACAEIRAARAQRETAAFIAETKRDRKRREEQAKGVKRKATADKQLEGQPKLKKARL